MISYCRDIFGLWLIRIGALIMTRKTFQVFIRRICEGKEGAQE
jgi:hypothetical protein